MIQDLDATTVPTVAIIGGGFSGTALAVSLLSAGAPTSLRVVMIESAPQVAAGAAYGTRSPHHLLNVPARGMSALPDRPAHFLEWLHRHDPSTQPYTFAPRITYSRYLRELLAAAERDRLPGRSLTIVRSEVVAVVPVAGRAALRLHLRDGSDLEAERVVLAVGHAVPDNPPLADPTFYDSPRYRRNPWTGERDAALTATDALLLIGSGLTMVDQVVDLYAAGHRGIIHVLSRHGLPPLVHRRPEQSAATVPLVLPEGAPSLRPLLRALRRAGEAAIARDEPWQDTLDTVRPQTQALWQGLSLPERRRFLRHARRYWDIHRHRVAPEIGAQVDELRRAGQLELHAGRLRAFTEDSSGVTVAYQPRGGGAERTLRVAQVINCTGPTAGVYRRADALFATLRAGRLIRPDELELGLDVAPDGALISADGVPSPLLYTFGPLQVGRLWETTAVPELRVQAAALGQALIESLAARA